MADTVITKRVSDATDTITETSTLRVVTTGLVVANPPTLGTRNWGETWGGFVSLAPAQDRDSCWGRTWNTGGTATDVTSASPSINNTNRIADATSTITETSTKRVPLSVT